MDKIYYTIYKVTNKISGKFYIGTHKTKNLDDGYMGSGKYLKRAIIKHGTENFEKEILFVFDTPEEMYAKEAEIVNEDFLAEQNTYNLRIGGFGGFDYINQTMSPEVRRQRAKAGRDAANKNGAVQKAVKARALLNEDPSWSNAVKKRMSIARQGDGNGFFGKKHTEESKKKIGKANSKLIGSRNSQHGTRWIHSVVEQRSTKIKKEDPLPNGWIEGRKIKFTR